MHLAIDVGATKTLIALFSEHGRCLKRTKFLTNKNSKLFLQELISNLTPFSNKKIHSVTIAVPAVVKKDYSFIPANLPWKNINIISPLKKMFKTAKIAILNDADLATLYESGPYAGKTIYFTFSTGIGGGIAKDGVVQKTSATFEPGHKIYYFGEENKEWEKFASANALKKLLQKNVSEITKDTDLDAVAFRLSIGLSDIINHYHPNTIIIGGPVGNILKKIRPSLIDYIFPKINSLPKIVKAKRPEESVIYGCYLYGKFH